MILPQPTAPWGTKWRDVRVLRQAPRQLTVSWVDPSVPAWFTATFDRATSRPIDLQMTAAAHFMRQRYVAYDAPIRIAPPPDEQVGWPRCSPIRPKGSDD